MADNSAKHQVQSGERPKWVPLREDQHTDLSSLARELMRARSHKGGGRITENTVIRVAVDLVVRHPDLLSGDTEDDLRTNAFARYEQLLEREQAMLAGGTEDGTEGSR
ncbi:hypothetical protein [Streptomyces sp. SS]|uniref:hypothetical protein n=1 Tax=Streptomyces sp. SS TaxID=260742 RepID=UPI0002D3F53F|nr:hypothetical protein [Streptomyces sp. SS]